VWIGPQSFVLDCSQNALHLTVTQSGTLGELRNRC
jgi:hypothetical protein